MCESTECHSDIYPGLFIKPIRICNVLGKQNIFVGLFLQNIPPISPPQWAVDNRMIVTFTLNFFQGVAINRWCFRHKS